MLAGIYPANAISLLRPVWLEAPAGQDQSARNQSAIPGGSRKGKPVMLRPYCPLVLSTSDDNLLKNIELFDKLALRFHGRLLFLKDVLGDEICCWSFYGQGRKIAEVCCTSIVYATEKKQTKVRGVQDLVREA